MKIKKILEESKLNITEDNAADILSAGHFLVKPNIQGKKHSISLERPLGINKKPECMIQGKSYADMTDEEKQEVEAYRVGNKIRTTIKFLPEDKLKKINSIQGRVRSDFYDACSGPNIMTIKQYEDFKAVINTASKELDKVLVGIELDWDNLIQKFENDIKVKYPYVKEDKLQKLIKSLGTGKEFRNSYSMTLDYTAIPNSYSVKGINVNYQKEAEKKINEQAIKDIENIIGANLNSAYQALNRLLISNRELASKKSKLLIASKTKGSVVNLQLQLESKLGFLKVDSIDNLIDEIGEVVKLKDDKELLRQTEVILAKIYGYMKDNNLKDEYLDLEYSVLSEDILEVYI